MRRRTGSRLSIPRGARFSFRPRSVLPGFFLAICTAGCAAESLETPSARSLDELAQGALAQIEGEIRVDGLRDPVEVIRDEWGIPHIYAQNTEDLFFAQGYVTAQDRLWQMELWRRWREGRLAEIFGPEAFDHDVRARQMMYRGPWDDREWTSYHPEGERIFTAFASGVNAYIEQYRTNLPVEFQLTGVTPDPWTARTVVLRWANAALSSVRGHAVNEIQLAMNVARLGVEEANRLASPDPWDDLVVPEGLDLHLIGDEVLAAMRSGDDDPFAPGRLPTLEILPEFRELVERHAAVALLPPMQEVVDAGSNNWVMSGEWSTTGVPILANDPHRRIEMPALRYFVHLNAPGWNVFGAGEPPFVGVDAGHNDSMAWGFTFAGTDMVDVFVEELHPEDPNRVRWQDGWEVLRTEIEEIQVKGEAPRTVEIRFSRHGPILHEDRENLRAYAVRSVVHEPGTAAYMGSFQLAQADGCADFFERAMAWKVPTHSLICGDAQGNIALQVSGLTPDRSGWNGRLPVPGTGKYAWVGFREDLPREFNPERGYIATANNNVHPEGYEGRPVFYHSTSGVETSRITRLHQIFQGSAPLSLEDHQRIQHDAYSLVAERDLPLFPGWSSADPDVEWARGVVAEWDGVLDRESVAGALFVRWNAAIESAARNPATPMEDRWRLTEDALLEAVGRLTAEQGDNRSEWSYGRVHQSALPHTFIPAFDLPTIDRGGGFGTVNATGANFRRIIDLSDPDRSVGSNAPGQSGQPGSPFYGNLREYLGNGEYFPLALSREAVDGQAAYRLTLWP